MNVDTLEKLLKKTHYDPEETKFLVDGFKNGFDIGYEGPHNRQDTSNNIPFLNGVGSNDELWDKVRWS